jgi:hypothetical protein
MTFPPLPQRASLFAAALLSVLAVAAPADAKKGTNVGVLECTIDGGVGLIVGSQRDVSCVFKPTKGERQRYRGKITKIGLDIGVTGKAYVVWAVFAPGSVKSGALAGDYGGASGEASIGVGLGANVLVGGFNKSIALQPLSVQGQTGVNLAVGAAGLKLKYRD